MRTKVSLSGGMMSDHCIAEATTFIVFCWTVQMLRRQLHQHCQARKQAPHITSTALSQQGRLSLATRKKLFIRTVVKALHVGQYCKTWFEFWVVLRGVRTW